MFFVSDGAPFFGEFLDKIWSYIDVVSLLLPLMLEGTFEAGRQINLKQNTPCSIWEMSSGQDGTHFLLNSIRNRRHNLN